MTATALFLDGRTHHRAVGTEYTAIPGLGPKQGFTAGALVKELAGIGRHRLLLLAAALRTGDDRLQHDFAHVFAP
jgi:hypothetical protein